MMRKYFCADLNFNNIYEITVDVLHEYGIKHVLVDLDNTLADYDTPYPTEQVLAWFKHLQDAGISVAIVSNNHEERVSRYCENIKLLHFWRSGKPMQRGIRRAMKAIGADRLTTALIGDKMWTDVLGARLSGIISIKVRSIKPRRIKWRR